MSDTVFIHERFASVLEVLQRKAVKSRDIDLESDLQSEISDLLTHVRKHGGPCHCPRFVSFGSPYA